MDVKRGPVLFRIDATPELGYEPLYQGLSLAAALQRRRRGTHFLSYLEPLGLAQTISRGNNAWIPAEQTMGTDGDLKAIQKEIRRLDAATVVVAGSNLNADYIRAVQDMGAMVIAIDPTASIKFPAEIVVNPLFAPGLKAYKFEPGTQVLLGRKFSLIRALFRRQRTIRAIEQPGPFRALVAFGDDDYGDQTLLRARQLLNAPLVEKISLMVRTHYERYEEIKDFADEYSDKVEVVTEAKETMTRLVRGHFALTSGCTWSLELCCVGIPQLVLPTKPHHVMNAKRMDDLGVANFLGASEDVSEIALHQAVKEVLEDPMERLGMSRCARKLVDGRGGDRVVNGMEIMLHSPNRLGRVERIAA